MKVVYVGPSAQVSIPACGAVAQNGAPVDVPQEIANGLLAQVDADGPRWQPYKKGSES